MTKVALISITILYQTTNINHCKCSQQKRFLDQPVFIRIKPKTLNLEKLHNTTRYDHLPNIFQ